MTSDTEYPFDLSHVRPCDPLTLTLQIQPASDLKSLRLESLQFQLRLLHSFSTDVGTTQGCDFAGAVQSSNRTILVRSQIVAIAILRFGCLSRRGRPEGVH